MIYAYPGIGSLDLVRWCLVILPLLGTSISTHFYIPGKCGLCCLAVCFVGLSARHMPRPGARRILALLIPVLVTFRTVPRLSWMIHLSRTSGRPYSPLCHFCRVPRKWRQWRRCPGSLHRIRRVFSGCSWVILVHRLIYLEKSPDCCGDPSNRCSSSGVEGLRG